MNTKQLLMSAAIGTAAIFGLNSCGDKKETSDNGDKVLRFTAIPDKDTTAQAERYKPVQDYLAKKLGIKVEFVASPDYSTSVVKFKQGDVHVAWFGGVSGVQARTAVEGAEALVSGEKDLAFKSYFIANKSTGLTRSEEFPVAIKDLKFTYGSVGSTSGCIMPTSFLMNATGKTPQEFFTKTFGFSGAHDLTAEKVNNGEFQVGALNFSTFDNLKKAGKADNCVIIWETPPFADYNLTAHPALKVAFGDDIFTKIQDALINCDDPAVLKALDRDKLIKVDNSTFKGVAEVMDKVSFE
ncbi:MAG: phosphate/phosphite/phosphonate ABC transporter substrate-binding protein [Rubritalea sp.]|jgi:phosphonate transport system substrate-binding protein|tara:strand:- start:2106 stop:2996 length:891 start_codon:yes stop_codon:yes gene_type:complete